MDMGVSKMVEGGFIHHPINLSARDGGNSGTNLGISLSNPINQVKG
jgi:hypothetical protein